MITITRANTIITHCNTDNILFIQILVFLRSSPPQVLLGGYILKISSKFIERLYIKVPAKIALWHDCSPVNELHIFRTHFPKYTSEGLLLISPVSGMNYTLIQDIKVSFLLFHYYTLLGCLKRYIIYYILLHNIL